MNWLGLEGKVAIVTGGAAGIGKACCEAFAQVGVKVVIADVNADTGNATVSEFMKKKYKADAIFATVDVTNKKSVDAMIVTTLETFGRVDILLNNAGILIPRLLVDPAGKEE